jgi:VanZ family protein
MLRSARIIAWVLVFILTLLSVVPPWLRPTTNVSHNVEHFAALFVTGVAFGLGYSRRPVIVGLVLVFFCAAIEIVQLLVPGRHARLSDFIVDAVAATAGVAAAFVGGRAAKGSRYRRWLAWSFSLRRFQNRTTGAPLLSSMNATPRQFQLSGESQAQWLFDRDLVLRGDFGFVLPTWNFGLHFSEQTPGTRMVLFLEGVECRQT